MEIHIRWNELVTDYLYRTRSHYYGLGLKFVEAGINVQLFTFEINPLLTRHIAKWT